MENLWVPNHNGEISLFEISFLKNSNIGWSICNQCSRERLLQSSWSFCHFHSHWLRSRVITLPEIVPTIVNYGQRVVLVALLRKTLSLTHTRRHIHLDIKKKKFYKLMIPPPLLLPNIFIVSRWFETTSSSSSGFNINKIT